VHIVLDSTYETMSISTGLHPNPDLWNANKLRYIILHLCFVWISEKTVSVALYSLNWLVFWWRHCVFCEV